MLLGIYLFECYLRGIYKSPSALFRIKKSETAPKQHQKQKHLTALPAKGDQKPAKAIDPEAWRMSRNVPGGENQNFVS